MSFVRLLFAGAAFLGAAAFLRLLLGVAAGESLATLLSPAALTERMLSLDLFIAALLLAAGLCIELAIVGWQRSAMRRLAVGSRDGRPHDDLVFLTMELSGFKSALVSLAALGLWDWLSAFYQGAMPGGPLASLPAWQAAPLIYLAMTFVNYWAHRLMHTKWLWAEHAVHHSAPEFTMVNITRTAIPDHIIVGICQGGVAALLGGSPDAIYWAFLMATGESLYTHSNIKGLHWLERFGIFSPKGHAIHHARDPRYHDSNFGDLICLWDRLFGTYISSASAPDDIAIGVDDPAGIYVSGHPLRDYFLPHWLWLKDIGGHLGLPRNQRNKTA